MSEIMVGKLCQIVGDFPMSGTIGEIIGNGPVRTDSWEVAALNFVQYIPRPNLRVIPEGELAPAEEREIREVARMLKRLARRYHATKGR